MLTVRGQHRSFSAHDRMFLWKFLRQKMYRSEGGGCELCKHILFDLVISGHLPDSYLAAGKMLVILTPFRAVC